MKEDEERSKEVAKVRQMKKALKKQKVRARSGTLTCFDTRAVKPKPKQLQ